ncbi:HTH CENPB-type domain-containing protein [Trichonephila clavipes]|nr:HTH CENPB-type domain-containing protein [Trichonephila clavipes]
MKALKFYKELKESEPSTSSRESNPQFSASTGWLTGFIKRHSFHILKIKGEVASADEEAARKYPEKLAKIIKDGEYCAHQVFNADETGLFWKNANPYLHCKVLDESRSFFRVHTSYFSNIPKCIKAEFIASWACSQSSVVSSSKR